MKSFSADVKKELSELKNLSDKRLVKAELMGYLITNSSNKFSTTNQYNINRYGKLLDNIGEKNFLITVKGNLFEIKTKKVISVEQEIDTDDEKRALIRGAFLGTGTLTNPENIYHLDISFEKKEYAELIRALLNEREILSKITIRENKYVVYIKDGDNISRFLAFIGANKSVLKFEDTRALKEIRNNINRLVNCETANLNKTIGSAVKQIEDIKLIKSKKMFNLLGKKEKELAELRLKNPDASLSELGELLDPPISKSGVNHRMKKIEELAYALKQ